MKKFRGTQRDYTTSEAAKICKCSQQTIIRCFDRGIIYGYYALGSRHRRILPTNLFKYMKENNIPLDNFPKKDIPKNSLEYIAKTKK